MRTAIVYGEELGNGKPALAIEVHQPDKDTVEIKLCQRICPQPNLFGNIMGTFESEIGYTEKAANKEKGGTLITLHRRYFVGGVMPAPIDIESTFALILVAKLGQRILVQRVSWK
jgi:hypothetical protein